MPLGKKKLTREERDRESYAERTRRLGHPPGQRQKETIEHRPRCPTCPGYPPMKTLYERIGASGQFQATGIFMCPKCRSFSRPK